MKKRQKKLRRRKKKAGRPQRAEGRESKAYFQVRVTRDELEDLFTKAKHLGMTLSDFVRAKALGARVRPVAAVPEVNVQVYEELARTAANINQLAHHLNEGRITGKIRSINVETVHEELRRMYGHVAALRRDLLGAPHHDSEHQQG